MNDYMEYMNSLSSVIADRNEEIAQQQREYASKLPGIEETKAIIETATGLPSSIFLEKGLSNFILKKEGRSYIAKGAKNIFNKTRQYYNDNYSKNTAERRAQGGQQAEEPTETEYSNPTFDPDQEVQPVEAQPFEEGTPIDFDAPEGSPDVGGAEASEGAEASGEATAGEGGSFLDNLYSQSDIVNNTDLYKRYVKQQNPEMELPDDAEIENSRQSDLWNIENGFEDGDKQVFLQPEESAVRDQLAPMRDMMNRQPQGQENGGVRPEQTEESGSGDASADATANPEAGSVGTSEDVSNAIESAEASSGAGEGAGAGAGAGAGEGAGAGLGAGAGAGAEADATGEALGNLASKVPEALGAALDFDPFTALIGLVLGIGGLIGGIEGADSVKNPPKPTAPPQELVSVVKGAGGF